MLTPGPVLGRKKKQLRRANFPVMLTEVGGRDMSNGHRQTWRLTVGQAIVKYLQVQYSERDDHQRRLIPAMFGIFGHGNVAGFGQALQANASQMPFYRPNNEQSMVHTASGFAKASRRLATLACTSSIGPGATNMIKAAKRPMIIAGGGVYYSEAEEDLQAFAEAFGIPVSETSAGKGSIRNASALLLGGQGANGTGVAGEISRQTDLVICVGTRLTDFSTGSHSAFHNPDVKFIGINVSDFDAYKQGALPIVADARLALQALTAKASSAGIKPRADYLREIAELKAVWDAKVQEAYEYAPGQVMTQGQLISVLNDQAQTGDIVVAAGARPPRARLKRLAVSGPASAPSAI